VVSYDELLAAFWASHSPRRAPYSRQYMAAAFPTDADQLAQAIASRDRLGFEAATPIIAHAHARFYLAEDYHQKYHLRQHAELMREFAGYSPRQLVDSTVAARLNGYVGGRGTLARLRDELPGFGLSGGATAYLLRTVQR
jgi:peptide-methionine (S)-S-oxide reductase